MSAHNDRLYFRLQRATHLLKKAADRRLIAAANVTTAQAAALFVIAKDKSGEDSGGVTQRHVAATLGQNESAVTTMVTRLLGLGYIERTRCPADSRAWLLQITKAGEQAMQSMSAPFGEINKRLDDALGESEREAVTAALKSIIDAFKNDSEETP